MRARFLLTGLLSVAMAFAGAQIARANPTDPPPSDTRVSVSKLHRTRSLQQNLRDEGLAATKVNLSRQAIELDGESLATDDGFAYELDLRVDNGVTGTYRIRDKADGEAAAAVFQVKVAEATPERVRFTLVDPATGETYRYDSATATKSIAFAIPLGIAAISLGTLLYYLAIGAAIIIAGYIALEAAKAVPKILEEYRRSAKYDYYTAQRSNGKLFIGAHLTNGQAQARGRTGGDVWAVSATRAKALAKTLNPSGVPVWHSPHGAGYLYHYHPYKFTPSMHSFYGS